MHEVVLSCSLLLVLIRSYHNAYTSVYAETYHTSENKVRSIQSLTFSTLSIALCAFRSRARLIDRKLFEEQRQQYCTCNSLHIIFCLYKQDYVSWNHICISQDKQHVCVYHHFFLPNMNCGAIQTKMWCIGRGCF